MTSAFPAQLERLSARLTLRLGEFSLDVDWQATIGGVVGVFGPSGAGKSSLLRCLAGLEKQCRGTVQLGEHCWQDTARGIFVAPHQRGVGMVFQDSRLFPHLRVRGNLEYGYRRVPLAERRLSFEQVVGWLDLETLLERAPASLSGGERQRVALGRALLAQPRLLLLDEPLAALDQRRKQDTLPYFKLLRETLAIPILYVSHSLDELVASADHLLLLEEGRLAAYGPLDTLLARVDLSLAQRDDAGAVIEATLAGHDERHHLSYLDVAGQQLSIARQPLATGATLRLRVHARDVALCLEPPRRSTLLNIIPATLVELAPAGQPGQVMVKLDIGGQTLLARITQKSAQALALRGGLPVYALIKSVALMA